ncbi:MAG TPA: cytochrome c3 family protein, partial [Candidatus Methanoperedens sp.]|nr:cytochrome c3 family protein [Candidatus Methanoperedens sp.]
MNKVERLIALLVVGIAMIAACPAMAAVDGSPHDMISYDTNLPKKQGVCSFCHIPHRAGGAKLWQGAPDNSAGGWSATETGSLCYSCHNGVTYPNAQEYLPFAGASHGRTVASLNGTGEGLNGAPTEGDGNLKCTSCHDVHNNATKPFLRWGTDLNSFCNKCHTGRYNGYGATIPVVGAANTNGNHPTDTLITDILGGGSAMQAAGIITGAADPANNALGAVLVAAADVTAASGTKLMATGWNLGAHIGDNTTTLTSGKMTCATCHMTHGNEGAGGTGVGKTGYDAGSPVINNKLLAINNVPDNTLTNHNTPGNMLCQWCHTFALPIGPGATGVTHPVNTSSWDVVITRPVGWPFGKTTAANDTIVCESCHDVHYGTASTALYRNTTATGTNGEKTQDLCNQCHSGGTTTWTHHPSNVATTNMKANPTISSATDWTLRTQTDTGVAYSFTGGKVTCGTCHFGNNGKAHNATASSGGTFPGIVGTVAESDMCVDCHGINPSNYTASKGVNTNATGTDASPAGHTHFVGNIVNAAYRQHASDNTSQNVWPTSGIKSKYGPDGTANVGSIICESCHYIKKVPGGSAYPSATNTG